MTNLAFADTPETLRNFSMAYHGDKQKQRLHTYFDAPQDRKVG